MISIDNFSHYTWIYLLHNISKLPKVYQDFSNMIHTQCSTSMKVFKYDNAKRYCELFFVVDNMAPFLTNLVQELLNKMAMLSKSSSHFCCSPR